MTALFDGIVDAIKETHPSSYSFTEKDVPAPSWMRQLQETRDDAFIPADPTVKEFTYAWRWDAYKIDVIIKTRDEPAYDKKSHDYTLFVSAGNVTILCNGEQVPLPGPGPELASITYNARWRTRPRGITSLLRAIQQGTVPVGPA